MNLSLAWTSSATKVSTTNGIFLLLFLIPSFAISQPSLQDRCNSIRSEAAHFGAGGLPVLENACAILREGRYTLVGIEDLWATALKEGKNLFGKPGLWKATGPQQTGDMLGQTTIGPWQITLQNAREYGTSYGIGPNWDDDKIVMLLENRPELQARLAADFIEDSYRQYGHRSPMAIQRYFWLDGFLDKRIGQGPWYASVLAKTPAAMKSTGFYAKQLLLGSRFNPQGLLFWLHKTGDDDAVRDTLLTWFVNKFPICAEDLSNCSCDPSFAGMVKALVAGLNHQLGSGCAE